MRVTVTALVALNSGNEICVYAEISSGENTESNMISGRSLRVTVSIELRQSQYVDWTPFNVTTVDVDENA